MPKTRTRKVSKKLRKTKKNVKKIIKQKKRTIKNLKGSGLANKTGPAIENKTFTRFNIDYRLRFNREQTILRKNNYEVSFNGIIAKKDEYKFKINMRDNYPDTSPIINGIDFSVNGVDFIDLDKTNISEMTEEQKKEIKFYNKDMTVNDLLNILIDKKNILIYCHPKSADTHFLKNDLIIPSLIGNNITNAKEKEEKLKEGKLIYNTANKITIDIKNFGSPGEIPNDRPTILADGFSDEFINDNKIYDYVLLPDCDGDWWMLQINKKQPTFNQLILKLTKLLRTGGKLILGKIVNTLMYDNVFEFFQNKPLNNFEIKKFTIDDNKFLMIIKKS